MSWAAATGRMKKGAAIPPSVVAHAYGDQEVRSAGRRTSARTTTIASMATNST